MYVHFHQKGDGECLWRLVFHDTHLLIYSIMSLPWVNQALDCLVQIFIMNKLQYCWKQRSKTNKQTNNCYKWLLETLVWHLIDTETGQTISTSQNHKIVSKMSVLSWHSSLLTTPVTSQVPGPFMQVTIKLPLSSFFLNNFNLTKNTWKYYWWQRTSKCVSLHLFLKETPNINCYLSI